jgi:hypothetical protein
MRNAWLEQQKFSFEDIFCDYYSQAAGSKRSKLIININLRGSLVIKALCYKPEDRGFDTRLGDFFLNLFNPSGRTRLWGLLSL